MVCGLMPFYRLAQGYAELIHFFVRGEPVEPHGCFFTTSGVYK